MGLDVKIAGPRACSRREVLVWSAALIALPHAAFADTAPEPFILRAAPADLTPAGADKPPVHGLAFNGTAPGPLLKARQGEEFRLRFVSGLDRPTALHWHGLRNANAVDGVAVPAGGAFDYAFTPPDAGLFCYHPLIAGGTAHQIGAGLYGVMIVDEAEPPKVDRDVVLVIADWPLGQDGQLARPPETATDLLTVNGKPVETLALRPNERIRLRLINASGSRIAGIAFAGFDPWVIALDGQPVDDPFEPAKHRMFVPPGGRVDILADAPASADAPAGIAVKDGAGFHEILHLTRADGPPLRERLPSPPKGLAWNSLPRAIDLARAVHAELALSAGADNRRAITKEGKAAGDGPLFSVKRGAPVGLGLKNTTGAVEVIHLHGHAARILHPLDDGWDPYWLDTIIAAPGETLHIAFTAGEPGRWPIHSALAGSYDAGMAGWFEVV